MTCIASILTGLMDAIDAWTADVLNATAADIQARSGTGDRDPS